MFKKIDEENNLTQEVKIVYIYPFEEEGENDDKYKNLIEIKRFILKNYIKTLTSDKRFWKFQLFDDNTHLSIFHWSDYLQKNKLVFNDVYAIMQKEGFLVKEQGVINIYFLIKFKSNLEYGFKRIKIFIQI